jgi:glycosyltransferase involved in cell wall biosynthesis
MLTAIAHLGHLQDIRLHVLGSGPLDGACRRLAERLGIAPRVVFHGFTAQVGERLAALDVLAMPSWHEGLPYTLLEAMSAGVPIVASRVGGLCEVLDGRECAILVSPRNPLDLASAIERLYRDPALRIRLATNARALAARQFAAVYEELVSR